MKILLLLIIPLILLLPSAEDRARQKSWDAFIDDIERKNKPLD